MACFTLQQKTHHSSVHPLGQVSCSSCTAEAKPRFLFALLLFALFFILFFIFLHRCSFAETQARVDHRHLVPVSELFVPSCRVALGGNATSAPDSSFLLARTHAYSTGQLTSLLAARAPLLALKPEISYSLLLRTSSCSPRRLFLFFFYTNIWTNFKK